MSSLEDTCVLSLLHINFIVSSRYSSPPVSILNTNTELISSYPDNGTLLNIFNLHFRKFEWNFWILVAVLRWWMRSDRQEKWDSSPTSCSPSPLPWTPGAGPLSGKWRRTRTNQVRNEKWEGPHPIPGLVILVVKLSPEIVYRAL